MATAKKPGRKSKAKTKAKTRTQSKKVTDLTREEALAVIADPDADYLSTIQACKVVYPVWTHQDTVMACQYELLLIGKDPAKSKERLAVIRQLVYAQQNIKEEAIATLEHKIAVLQFIDESPDHPRPHIDDYFPVECNGSSSDSTE